MFTQQRHSLRAPRLLGVGAILLGVAVLAYPARGEDPGQEDLDKATAARVTAKTPQDLNNLIKLLESALEKGLNADNKQYAEGQLAATLLQRGTIFGTVVLEQRPPDPRWPQIREFALRDLRRAVELKKQDAETYFLIARLLALPGGDRDEARKALGVVTDSTDAPTRLRAQAHILRAALQTDKTKRAVDFDKAVELMPGDADMLKTRAMFHLDANRADEALGDLDRALKLEPEDAGLYEARGMALLIKKDDDKALESFEKASELAPDAPSPHLRCAQIYADRDDLPKALKAIDKAIELAPESASSLLLRSWIRLKAKDEKGSLADVDRAIELRPKNIAAQRMKASLLASMDRLDEAIEHVRKMSREAPDDMEIMLQLGELYHANKQPRRAIQIFAAVLTSDSKNLQALRDRADSLLSIGKQREAIADYESSLKIKPDQSGVLNNLAWVLATSPDESVRDGSRAIELATKACELTEYKLAHILSTLAAAYAESGDFENARKWSKKAVEIGDEEADDQLAQELKSYEAGKPWREKQVVEEKESKDTPNDESPLDGSPESAPARTPDF